MVYSSTTLGELRKYIPRSLREAIMQEFHDLPSAGHLGKRKTYLKLRDTCYFPYMRKYIFEYVLTCDRCQKFKYKNALPAGRLIPIVSNYPKEIVPLALSGLYPTFRPERYRFLLVTTDHFTKWKGAEYVGRNIEKLFDEARQNRRKQPNIGKNILIGKGGMLTSKGKKVTVNIDQVRVYRPRQSDTISSDSHVETLYDAQRSSDRSSRSQPQKISKDLGKPLVSRITVINQWYWARTRDKASHSPIPIPLGYHGHKGNAGWEDLRLKRKVDSNGSGDRKNIKKSKICRKRSLQGSEHRDQKRPTPEPKQGIKRAIPSSVSSRNHKCRRPNNPSQGSQSIACPSHQRDSKQDKPPTVASRHEGSGQYNKTTKSGTNRASERRTVRSNQMTLVRPCPYYLRS
ncbi:uncharacterized protein TNCV_3931091 [Trichonephila clavipes]|nr:uncharacterized protein TNCV_3931091 [Trichonephila clavipes]